MRWRSRATRAAIAVVSALALTAALAGCTSAPDALAGPRFVTPALIHYTSALWPVPLQLVGAQPGSLARLDATIASRRGTGTSSATYVVPGSGALDLAAARPQRAAFTEPDSAGLFWSLRGPHLIGDDLAMFWMRSSQPVRIDAVTDGRVIASHTFLLDGLGVRERLSTVYGRDLRAAEAARDATSPGLPDPPQETHEDGLIGWFYPTSSIERPRTPAVIVFDYPGAGASAEFVAPLLAQFGASVFVLPVDRRPDAVHTASAIDASTISAVLDWLVTRPDIERGQVFAYGTSQSEQLVFWAATRFTGRIQGVFAAGGASALLCLLPGGVGPAYENGVGSDCQNDVRRIDDSEVLSLDAVKGSVVLGCAEEDEVPPNACGWLDAAMRSRGIRAGDRIVRAEHAVHAMTVPPGLPIALPVGGTAQPTQKARIAFWNAVGSVLLRAVQS